MSLHQMVTTALKTSPVATSLVAEIVRDMDAKRAAAHRALLAAEVQGEREIRAALDAEAAATRKLEAAVRAQSEATVELSQTWQARNRVVFVAETREDRLRREVEALSAPALRLFVAWADELAAAVTAAPLPSPETPGRRHAWDVGVRSAESAWVREQAVHAGVLELIRDVRERALALRLAGDPQAATAKVLGGYVRAIRKAAAAIGDLRASPLMQGDPLAEPSDLSDPDRA